MLTVHLMPDYLELPASLVMRSWRRCPKRKCALVNCNVPTDGYIFSIRNGLLRRRAESMAQKVQVLLVDDLDGSEATETVSFGLDGVSYEIDLSTGNAGELRKELAHYVDHARKSNAPARAAEQAGSRARESASGRSRAASRSMSAVAFPPTSWPSTRPPTSVNSWPARASADPGGCRPSRLPVPACRSYIRLTSASCPPRP
jgi:Lsr2